MTTKKNKKSQNHGVEPSSAVEEPKSVAEEIKVEPKQNLENKVQETPINEDPFQPPQPIDYPAKLNSALEDLDKNWSEDVAYNFNEDLEKYEKQGKDITPYTSQYKIILGKQKPKKSESPNEESLTPSDSYKPTFGSKLKRKAKVALTGTAIAALLLGTGIGIFSRKDCGNQLSYIQNSIEQAYYPPENKPFKKPIPSKDSNPLAVAFGNMDAKSGDTTTQSSPSSEPAQVSEEPTPEQPAEKTCNVRSIGFCGYTEADASEAGIIKGKYAEELGLKLDKEDNKLYILANKNVQKFAGDLGKQLKGVVFSKDKNVKPLEVILDENGIGSIDVDSKNYTMASIETSDDVRLASSKFSDSTHDSYIQKKLGIKSAKEVVSQPIIQEGQTVGVQYGKTTEPVKASNLDDDYLKSLSAKPETTIISGDTAEQVLVAPVVPAAIEVNEFQGAQPVIQAGTTIQDSQCKTGQCLDQQMVDKLGLKIVANQAPYMLSDFEKQVRPDGGLNIIFHAQDQDPENDSIKIFQLDQNGDILHSFSESNDAILITEGPITSDLETKICASDASHLYGSLNFSDDQCKTYTITAEKAPVETQIPTTVVAPKEDSFNTYNLSIRKRFPWKLNKDYEWLETEKSEKAPNDIRRIIELPQDYKLNSYIIHTDSPAQDLEVTVFDEDGLSVKSELNINRNGNAKLKRSTVENAAIIKIKDPLTHDALFLNTGVDLPAFYLFDEMGNKVNYDSVDENGNVQSVLERGHKYTVVRSPEQYLHDSFELYLVEDGIEKRLNDNNQFEINSDST
ncbi:MAG: hypothetical protein KKD48_03640, partial [Nanoarchaeota archaeon]|nr:hypothetical protein [Nanoarchaeota archaeon]